MTGHVDLLTRAAQTLRDLTDEAYEDFGLHHGDPRSSDWASAMSNWVDGPIGAYAAVISQLAIGYALADELRKRAASLEEHLPTWTRLEEADRHSPNPHTAAELVEFHHGTMLDIARAILGKDVHD